MMKRSTEKAANPGFQSSSSYQNNQNNNNTRTSGYSYKNPFSHSNTYEHPYNPFQSQKTQRRTQESETEDMSEKEFAEFEKAFNSYLRHGYLKPKYHKFRSAFEELSRFNSGFYEFGQESMYTTSKKQKRKEKKQENVYKTSEKSFTKGEKKTGKSSRFEKYTEEDDFDEDFDENFSANPFENFETREEIKSSHRIKKLDIAKTIEIEIGNIGKTVRVKVEKEINCHKCEFTPHQNYVKTPCKSCLKSKSEGKCPVCKGKRFVMTYNCKLCDNKKTFRKSIEEIVLIPEGIRNGWKLVLEGRGNQHKRGRFGDLILTIRIVNKVNADKKQSKEFNSDDIPLEIFEAVLGCTMIFSQGKAKFEFKVPAGVQDGETIRTFDSKTKKENGKIKIHLNVPTKITPDERVIYEKLRAIQNKSSE